MQKKLAKEKSISAATAVPYTRDEATIIADSGSSMRTVVLCSFFFSFILTLFSYIFFGNCKFTRPELAKKLPPV